MDYDGSQIPAEWYGWMHYKVSLTLYDLFLYRINVIQLCFQTDLPPDRDGSRPKYKWIMDHSENVSGTTDAYMPYSTTTPKIEAWKPKSSS